MDALWSALRAVLAVVGLLALPDPAVVGAFGTVALVVMVATLLVVAALASIGVDAGRASPIQATRAALLAAPLSQSDPDAAGHVRPRGPDVAASAA